MGGPRVAGDREGGKGTQRPAHPALAGRGRAGELPPAAHLQPGRSAGMAGSGLLPLALAVLVLVRPRDSSVVLAVTGKLVEENGVTPGDSGAGGTGLGPSQTPAGLVPTPEGHLSWDTGQ